MNWGQQLEESAIVPKIIFLTFIEIIYFQVSGHEIIYSLSKTKFVICTV